MLTPWKESYDQLRQHIKKKRHYFANKGLSSQSCVSSSSDVWMWELDHKESWTPKNWCFWAVCWKRLLRVPWTARRSNQSILKEICPGCSWKDWCGCWNSNTLATWWEELTQLKRPWWERLRAGEEGDDRRWDGWMDGITNSMEWVCVNSGSWWWTGRPGMLRFKRPQRVGHDWATELNWNKLPW